MRFYVAAVAASLVLAGVSTAHAYSYLACNGRPKRWEHNSLPFVRGNCSIPPGSAADSAMWNAVNESRAVVTVASVPYQWPSNRCTVAHQDNYNDIALVNPASIDGALGTTVMRLSGCNFSWDTSYIQEADVLVADNLTFNNPEPSDLGDIGYDTFLHEVGHAHGLDHFDQFNIMRARGTGPNVGGFGSRKQWMPDDNWGLRFLYPGQAYDRRNLTLSVQEFTSGGVTNIVSNTNTIRRCRGQTVSASVTVINNGTWSAAYRLSAWLSKTAPYQGGYDGVGAHYIGADVASRTMVANYWEARSISYPVPSYVPNQPFAGAYYLYLKVTSDSAEWSTADNTVVWPVQIIVDC